MFHRELQIERRLKKIQTEKSDLFTEEAIFTNNAIIPKGIRLPVNIENPRNDDASADEKLIVTTAIEPFTLYVTVSLIYGNCDFNSVFALANLGFYFSRAL